MLQSMSAERSLHSRAVLMLVLATLFWGVSFPLVKALALAQLQVLPASSTWFITAGTVAPRFLLGAAVLLVVLGKKLATFTRPELRQGALLGLAVGAGMLFQNDGLQFTEASTSAFLTQIYAIMIPAWIALRSRRAPPGVVWGCGALVLAGVAILGRFDFRTMHLGRGEAETLLSSVFFMMQIFLLERKEFAANRALPVTLMMFATEAVVFTGLALVTAPHPADVLVPWTSGAWLAFTGLLTVFCTLGAFILMNTWQPKISAIEAGLIYCVEPVFTAVMALFLPAIFSAWGNFAYANESVTWNLLVGGGLITAANVLLQLKPLPKG
ncbi:MAG: EamA-like transporter family protein [Lacunisphaera sp.]|nr:EamA-like transporter family protein [Lacunisphaera sp.]